MQFLLKFVVMWSIFSRDPTKDFAYDVGSQVSGFEERSIWTLHEGKHKVMMVVSTRPRQLVLHLNVCILDARDIGLDPWFRHQHL